MIDEVEVEDTMTETTITTEMVTTETTETEEMVVVTTTEMTEMVVAKTTTTKTEDKMPDTKRKTLKMKIKWKSKTPEPAIEKEEREKKTDHQEKSLKLLMKTWVNNLERTSKVSFKLKSITNI